MKRKEKMCKVQSACALHGSFLIEKMNPTWHTFHASKALFRIYLLQKRVKTNTLI